MKCKTNYILETRSEFNMFGNNLYVSGPVNK